MENKYHIGYKTLWETEKLLVTSNFSFSHNVFYSYISLGRQNVATCGNGLTLHQNKMYFRNTNAPETAFFFWEM